jgi:hypothetical protein
LRFAIASAAPTTVQLNPLDPADALLDPDEDGSTNLEEYLNGTSPERADTDGDGTPDGDEVDSGGDPTDPSDDGQPPPSEEMVEIPFTVGDPSSSHSERWKMDIQGEGPDDKRQFSIVNSEYGTMTPQNYKLRRGNRYTITLSHVDSKEDKPDYDWQAQINGQPATSVLEGGVKHTENDRFTVIQNAWLLDNEDGLLGVVNQSFNKTNHATGKKAVLLPVDIDIVHPATGELAEDREDGTSASPDGGYVSVKRTIGSDVIGGEDVTPITKLKIHTIAGAQSTWKTRVKFSGADRYKIYKDEERSEEVLSEQTEFDATQTTTLYFQGLKKSLSRGGENVTMQVKVGNDWVDGDSVKCTVVQSEFLIQIKAFIPYEWTEGEYIPQPLPDPVRGKVAKGDYGATSRPTFKNAFSNKVSFYSVAPFRLCHEVILTPYVNLHYFYQDIEEKRQFTSAPSSDHYIKATSVDPTELALKNGYLPLTPPIDATGPPVLSPATYSPELSLYNSLRANKCALNLTGSGRDGALGIYTDVSPAIDWDVRLEIDSSSNPLQPSFRVKGNHDLYPAYEIITLQADGSFKDTHRHMPARNELPGPASLSTAPSITFDNTGTISN